MQNAVVAKPLFLEYMCSGGEATFLKYICISGEGAKPTFCSLYTSY